MNACEYCGSEGKVRAGKDDGLKQDAYVCDRCWELLKDPRTALPLIRGHLTLELRKSERMGSSDDALNRYMAMLAAWKARS